MLWKLAQRGILDERADESNLLVNALTFQTNSIETACLLLRVPEVAEAALEPARLQPSCSAADVRFQAGDFR